MTITEAVRKLADQFKVSKGTARKMLDNGFFELAEDDRPRNTEDAYYIARDFYAQEGIVGTV